jgi:hypothetical protein
MADWFEPKRYGYGAGRPIAWQGWAVTIAYVILIGGALAFLPGKPLVFAAIIIPATVLLILVSALTTRGGWRWRWGSRA